VEVPDKVQVYVYDEANQLKGVNVTWGEE